VAGGKLWRRVKRLVGLGLAGFLMLSLGLVVLYGFLPVPATPLMVIRLFEGEGWSKDWVAYEDVSPHVFTAVIAAEDARFCQHYGFELEAMYAAWQSNRRGKRIRGGSTLSMQTAKNIFLWPGRDYVRKAFEAYFTVLLELMWEKRRILEVYVNVVEFGPGVYGIEAAAQAFFKKSAKNLSRREAALLAAVLPNPRKYSAARPGPYVSHQASRYVARMADLPPPVDARCPVGPQEDAK